MSVKELQDGSTYEKFLETEFALIPKKKSILPQQEEQINRTDILRLQVNLTKNNLKELGIGPGLITQIVEDLKLVEGDLLEFNKYFPTFKSATSNNKIKSLTDFRTEWSLFKDQRIGKEIQQITSPLNITLPIQKGYTENELEQLTSEELDKLFRLHIMEDYRTTVDEIRTIKYVTSKGTLSKDDIILYNKDSIITFSSKGTSRGDLPINYNNIKIRYIYKKLHPTSKPLKDVKWTGPQLLQGEGFKKKRRSVLMRYR